MAPLLSSPRETFSVFRPLSCRSLGGFRPSHSQRRTAPFLHMTWPKALVLSHLPTMTTACPSRNPVVPQVYSAAKSMLGSSKLPVKMAGISLSGALYAAEGDVARDDLGVEDMEARIKSQVRCFSWIEQVFVVLRNPHGAETGTVFCCCEDRATITTGSCLCVGKWRSASCKTRGQTLRVQLLFSRQMWYYSQKPSSDGSLGMALHSCGTSFIRQDPPAPLQALWPSSGAILVKRSLNRRNPGISLLRPGVVVVPGQSITACGFMTTPPLCSLLFSLLSLADAARKGLRRCRCSRSTSWQR